MGKGLFKLQVKLTDEVTYEITYEVNEPVPIRIMLIFTKKQTCVSTVYFKQKQSFPKYNDRFGSSLTPNRINHH